MHTITIKMIPLIFLAGGMGAVSRWILSALVNSMVSRIWLGTLFVNILGSVILYLVTKTFPDRHDEVMMMVKIGFLGALTTFSTFAFELVTLIKTGRYLEAGVVLTLNVLTGIIVGIWILR